MLQMTRPAGRPKSDRVPLLGWFSAIRVMFSSRNTAIIIRRVYDTIHMGLWAPLVAFPTSRNRICSCDRTSLPHSWNLEKQEHGTGHNRAQIPDGRAHLRPPVSPETGNRGPNPEKGPLIGRAVSGSRLRGWRR